VIHLAAVLVQVNGIPLGLDPRRLVHEVSDGDTYQLGFLVLPFDTSEQRQRFGDASMLVLHAHILQESRTFMRSCCEGDEDRVTAMKVRAATVPCRVPRALVFIARFSS